ncbi:electron transfer flavoprotein subunit alpha/FixB family protein [Robiginitalea aurantiaca]|uniref:Electron transfer flavoprotein subunit alpha/FixB family protein n=1 Tax=Robiginitalea aurantiaca TaxID=3056915 RepID=A0ABT7WHU1_9FLAO|nr:electron transfer flavoprotein subunit alpha/FixB family protein [Robiginitalea aurantiaca]MDM9632487.1 electron transfer flavoprotein subunit alpha/FixB family protein [Robiginitalea aurantiaca]
MPVLVYTESDKGGFKKNAFEVASYASELAKSMGTEVIALSVNAENPDQLGAFGISRVLNVTEDRLDAFNAKAIASVMRQAVAETNATVVVTSSSTDTKYAAAILAGMLKGGYVNNVVSLPESTEPLVVKRTAFSNKGFAFTELKGEPAIIGVSNNAFGAREHAVTANVESFSPNVSDSDFGVKSTAVDKASDKVTIADAEIVVSGGRGLKGPENWNLIEDLADVLGAATACSKPVSDLGWRPHSEHVGQTGKPVASNLYIAIGISGAIQHLAGVNASKTKVVINTDPEAPFFKAADYGVVGDAFEVVPELIEKLKEFKAQNG